MRNDEIKTTNKVKSNTQKKDEIYTGHNPIPINIAVKVMNAICKIIIDKKAEKKENNGTGFFLKVQSLKYLITNYHVINPEVINEVIKLQIHNKIIFKFNLNNRNIIYLEKPKDITAIEIKESDEFYENLEFLKYDNDYIEDGYMIYKDLNIFTVEHPFGDDASCASGRIINIDDYEFEHNISTGNGSSGCPIILLNNNINLIKVIGVHKNGDEIEQINGGTFIGEIIKEIVKKNENKDLYDLPSINFKCVCPCIFCMGGGQKIQWKCKNCEEDLKLNESGKIFCQRCNNHEYIWKYSFNCGNHDNEFHNISYQGFLVVLSSIGSQNNPPTGFLKTLTKQTLLHEDEFLSE